MLGEHCSGGTNQGFSGIQESGRGEDEVPTAGGPSLPVAGVMVGEAYKYYQEEALARSEPGSCAPRTLSASSLRVLNLTVPDADRVLRMQNIGVPRPEKLSVECILTTFPGDSAARVHGPLDSSAPFLTARLRRLVWEVVPVVFRGW